MRNRRYNIQKDFVFLTVSMCITVFLWVGFNIYDAYVTSTIDTELQTQIIPINGNFDLETIREIKNRSVILPDYTTASASAEAFPTVEPRLSQFPTITPAQEQAQPTEAPL